jgi:deoxyribodipyrimidine photolyase-related protein
MVDSEHFYTSRTEVNQVFSGRKTWVMEFFYRHMRTKHKVLMTKGEKGEKPIGGAWNFDHDNRKNWPGLPSEPPDSRILHDHSALWRQIQNAGVKSFGNPSAVSFLWPLNRDQALRQLNEFVQFSLPHFGEFQDAMSSKGWRLFHSLLSFALNTKMLTPQEVVQRVEAAYHAEAAPLNAVEGFIRQIIGWREYIRGVYWQRMPAYENENFFDHQEDLPSWFWTGETKMRCVASAISQSLEHAHAHHIQRLMVIGNFSLLAGLHPQRLHEWYLGVYIDAFEWVELPNTIGMSQYADGGHLATKPYVSSAAYIDRMSDYCQGCYYNKKLRTGENACPFNALYWDFYARHENKLGSNGRIGMAYMQLRKMDASAVTELKEQAKFWRENLERL